jgi:hypothetical protein
MSAIVDTEKEKEKIIKKDDNKSEPVTVLELLEEDDEFEVPCNYSLLILHLLIIH